LLSNFLNYLQKLINIFIHLKNFKDMPITPIARITNKLFITIIIILVLNKSYLPPNCGVWFSCLHHLKPQQLYKKLLIFLFTVFTLANEPQFFFGKIHNFTSIILNIYIIIIAPLSIQFFKFKYQIHIVDSTISLRFSFGPKLTKHGFALCTH